MRPSGCRSGTPLRWWSTLHNTEAGINGGLVRVSGGAEEIVEVESCGEVFVGREHLVDAEGELVGVRDYFGGHRVRVGTVRACRVIGQRIAGENLRDLRSGRNDQRIAWKRGCVYAKPLGGRGHREDLRCSKDLSETLILPEVEGLATSVVEMGHDDRAAVGEAEFVAPKRWDATGFGDGGMIEVVACVERRVTQELEDGTVESHCFRSAS